MNRLMIAATAALAATMTADGADRAPAATTFRVRVENVSKPDTLKTSMGTAPVAVAPVLWIVHTATAPLFTAGAKDRGEGLEQLAEDGNPAGLANALNGRNGIAALGFDNTPVGTAGPGPIVGGNAYEFTVTATPGSRLTLAMMFGQSNDIFYAADGIELFRNGVAAQGDVSSTITLWDAGTEVNQEPGVGADQAPRQKAANTGTAENGTVRLLSQVNDGFTYPAVGDVLKITITPEPMTTTRK